MAKATPPTRRILLVEDDLDQAHLIKFLLEAGGKYVVTLAQDGLRGTLLVRDSVWDLIITDLNLPGADGMEVVVTAKTHQPKTPILATTGYSGPQYADEALRKGATDVLIKPLAKDELLAKVDALAGMGAPPAPADGVGSALSAPASPPPVRGAPAAPAPAVPPAPVAPAPAAVAPPAPAAPARAAVAPSAPAAPAPAAVAPPAPAAPARAAPTTVGEAAGMEALGPDSSPSASPTRDGDRPLRVLAVSVRPGDAESGCGATLLRHRDRGDRVILLTLSHGPSATDGLKHRDQAKAAGRAMGVRFFVGNAGSGDESLLEDVKRLVKGALVEIRPDLVYLPTVHHAEATLRVAHQTVTSDVAGMYAIYAYDPGDGEMDFRPSAFVRVSDTLQEKLGVMAGFDSGIGAHVAPARAEVAARYWARFGGGEPVEPFEVVRGEAPPWLGDASLLP
jgi:CheY-like chemotaxis protein/LmbE family N-acetylglucosaminyl deacetylase